MLHRYCCEESNLDAAPLYVFDHRILTGKMTFCTPTPRCCTVALLHCCTAPLHCTVELQLTAPYKLHHTQAYDICTIQSRRAFPTTCSRVMCIDLSPLHGYSLEQSTYSAQLHGAASQCCCTLPFGDTVWFVVQYHAT